MSYKTLEKKREYQHRYETEHRAEINAKTRKRRQDPERHKRLLEYGRQYRITHREEINKQAKESRRKLRQTNPQWRERENRRQNEWKQSLRKQVITHFGGKCVKCGYSDWRALQVDHIEGGGRKGPHCSVRYYRDLLTAKPGITYQLLCANCNQIKKYENNENAGGSRFFKIRQLDFLGIRMEEKYELSSSEM